MEVFLILSWTVASLAFLREQPSPGRASVENDLHRLGGVSEVEFTLVTHILEVFQIDSLWAAHGGNFLLDVFLNQVIVILVLNKVDCLIVLRKENWVMWCLLELHKLLVLVAGLSNVN